MQTPSSSRRGVHSHAAPSALGAGSRRTRMISVVALVACVGLVAGCGARLSKAQVSAASGSTGSNDATGAATGAVTPGDQSTPGATTPPAGAGATATTAAPAGAAKAKTGGTTATTTAAKAATATGGAGATTTAPPGDNGGATDVGVTATSITLANVSTVTGPVPGLFAGAVNGTQAYFAYQNSMGGINGRQLKLQVGAYAIPVQETPA